MELDKLLLHRIRAVNHAIPAIANADTLLSVPLILEYIESLSAVFADAQFLKTLKSFFLMDAGCILLENARSVRTWDVGQSLSAPPNTFFIRYDPSGSHVALVKGVGADAIVVDTANPENKEVVEIVKVAGLSRFENLKTTLANIQRTLVINVDKSQLPSVRAVEGRVDLDYTTPTPQPDAETRGFILNIMLRPFLTSKENLDVVLSLAHALKGGNN
jgi:hypothetical protein